MAKLIRFILGLVTLVTTLTPLTYSQAQSGPVDSRENAAIYPVSYQLNALDPHSLADFYTETMGLSVIESEDDYFRLGASEDETLLEIYRADQPRGQTLTTGIYHVAYAYQDREYLGSHLVHLFNKEAPIEGFTHHGVSDAVYAADPEGNGIELYWDYPPSQWDYEDNDDIIMENEELDYMELLNSQEKEFDGIHGDVQIGHFHIVAQDLNNAGDFYQNIFGLETTASQTGDTRFQSSGSYHHHIANNEWFATQGLEHPETGQQGLRAMVWETATEAFYLEILTHLTEADIEFTEENHQVSFKDASGLNVIVRNANKE